MTLRFDSSLVYPQITRLVILVVESGPLFGHSVTSAHARCNNIVQVPYTWYTYTISRINQPENHNSNFVHV